jgi:indolepyruvate ferredoxin oxidoreductase beta subunit
MKRDIIIAGVGGQGILSIAATIGTAAIEAGLYLKQAEVHGMSQRGGDVQSHLRLSSETIASDLIPFGQADIIISVEPMESLRYLPMLSKKAWLVTNTKPFVNIPNYPPIEDVLEKINSLPQYIAMDADKMAHEIGSPKSVNIVILGASAPFLDMDTQLLENAILKIFRNKSEEIIQLNLEAFRAGLKFANENQ